MTTFSVVICTYQRADLLKTALQSLCQQSLDCAEYEVIVIDNNSTDHTQAIAEAFVNRLPNFKYHLEPNQGLSHARNRGWREAQGTYVAYIDDECKVPGRWLEAAKRLVDERNPGVLGGPFFGYHNE